MKVPIARRPSGYTASPRINKNLKTYYLKGKAIPDPAWSVDYLRRHADRIDTQWRHYADQIERLLHAEDVPSAVAYLLKMVGNSDPHWKRMQGAFRKAKSRDSKGISASIDVSEHAASVFRKEARRLKMPMAEYMAQLAKQIEGGAITGTPKAQSKGQQEPARKAPAKPTSASGKSPPWDGVQERRDPKNHYQREIEKRAQEGGTPATPPSPVVDRRRDIPEPTGDPLDLDSSMPLHVSPMQTGVKITLNKVDYHVTEVLRVMVQMKDGAETLPETYHCWMNTDKKVMAISHGKYREFVRLGVKRTHSLYPESKAVLKDLSELAEDSDYEFRYEIMD